MRAAQLRYRIVSVVIQDPFVQPLRASHTANRTVAVAFLRVDLIRNCCNADLFEVVELV